LIAISTEPFIPCPLIDDKALQYLGIAGQDFRLRWYSGAYRDDPRPEVQALDRLMRTGQWVPIT